MATNLRLTDFGRNAILDDENVGTRAVQITKLALGAGSGTGGADDDGRTTLRDQRDIVAATGSASVAGQIAVRGEFTSANAYAATEMGLFARIGAGGAEFLFAYWTDDGTVFINKPASLRTIVATTIALVRSAAAVEVTLAPEINVGTVAALLDLTDSPNSYVNAAKKKVAVKEDGTGVEFVQGLLDHEAADAAETRAGLLATKAVTPVGLKAVVDDLLNGAPGALDTLNELADALGDDPNFSATITALINQRLTQDQVDARIRAIGGIGNLAFFSRTASLAVTGNWVAAMSGQYTPSKANAKLGFIFQGRCSVTSGGIFGRIRLNSQTVAEIIIPNAQAGVGRQLYVASLAAATTVPVALEVRGDAGRGLWAPASLAVFELPATAAMDVLTEDGGQTTNAWSDIGLSVPITVPAGAKVALRLAARITGNAADVRLRRAAATIVEATAGAQLGLGVSRWPNNFEDWVDEPGAGTHTYSLQVKSSDQNTHGAVKLGSFLLADIA